MKLSGLLRLRDEETWCVLAIESFLPWLDELIIAVQPSMDRTRELVERYADRAVIMDWPTVCAPAGASVPDYDPHSITGFYNGVLKQATGTHAVKLDGDMVMMDWAGDEIRRRVEAGYDRVRFHGTDLVSDLCHIGCHPHCPTDGVFPRTGAHYIPSVWSCRLRVPGRPRETRIERPAFLHFKWCKPEGSATKRWPANWRDHERWRAIYERRIPVAEYRGEYPAGIKTLLNS